MNGGQPPQSNIRFEKSRGKNWIFEEQNLDFVLFFCSISWIESLLWSRGWVNAAVTYEAVLRESQLRGGYGRRTPASLWETILVP